MLVVLFRDGIGHRIEKYIKSFILSLFMTKKVLSVADFFCGAGGFSEGFRENGFEVKFALDNWQQAIDTHDLNHPNCKAVCMNILELDTPEKIDSVVSDTDVIVGSPPCVSFSGSNKAGKADKSLGIQLIQAYLRIVAWKKSKGHLKYWIMENVPNSEKYTKSRYSWKELGLPGKGKDLVIKQRNILNAADYGAAQGRLRFVCGDYPEPEKTHENKHTYTRNILTALGNPLDSKHKSIIKDPVHDLEIRSNKLTDHYYDSRVPEFEWKKAQRLKVDHGFMGKMSFPEKLDRTSRTIMATMSSSTRESIIFEAKKDGKHVGYRSPTIREAATIMGFPINYQFTGKSESIKYKQIGNAVCAPMSSALAKAILRKEKLPADKYFSLPNIKVPFNLNGKPRQIKEPRPRRTDSKFAVHVPKIKIRTMRVELTNKNSNFNKQHIKWQSILHQGSGKKAVSTEIPQKIVQKWLEKSEHDSKFIKAVKDKFSKINISHKELQIQHSLNENTKKITPEKALEIMKQLVDKYYPEKICEDKQIKINELSEYINRNEIPIRVLASLFTCNEFVNHLL